MRAVWQYWPGIIDDTTIDNIIAEGERYELAHAGMGFDGSSVNNEYRSSDIRWINKFQSKWISDLIYDYVTTANRNAFGFNVPVPELLIVPYVGSLKTASSFLTARVL